MPLAKYENEIKDANYYLPSSLNIYSEPESLECIAAKCIEIGFGQRQPIIFMLLD